MYPDLRVPNDWLEPKAVGSEEIPPQGLIRVFNLEKGKVISTLQTPPGSHYELKQFGINKDGTLFTCTDVQSTKGQVFCYPNFAALASGTSSLVPVDVDDGELVKRFGYSQDGNLLATIHEGHTVWLRDPITWKIQRQLTTTRGRNRRILFSPSGRYLAATASNGLGTDTHLRFWNTKTWNCLLYTSPSPRDQRGSRMPSSA